MTVDPEELVNLDVTIAEFVIPRLEAFRDAADSFPADLDTIEEWHAELDQMILSFRVRSSTDYAAPCDVVEAGLALFAKRLGHLWQ
jgi:hypothetical protein